MKAIDFFESVESGDSNFCEKFVMNYRFFQKVFFSKIMQKNCFTIPLWLIEHHMFLH